MATVTLKRTKSTQLLGYPAYKDAKTYFAVSLSQKTGERIKILTDEEALKFSLELNIPYDDLRLSSSNYWRDYSFIMQGASTELDDEDPYHQLAIKVLEKDERVAVNETDKVKKPKAEYILVKETEVTASKVKRGQTKADAYARFNTMDEEALKSTVLLLGKNPKALNLDKIKEFVLDAIEKEPSLFLRLVDDKNFNIKVFINDMVQEGIVSKSGAAYKFDGEMLAHDQESFIDYLKDKKNTNTVVAFKKQMNERKGMKVFNIKD